MIDYYGIRVREDPWLDDGQMLVVGHFAKPEGWETMTENEQTAYAIAHGAYLLVKNIGALAHG